MGKSLILSLFLASSLAFGGLGTCLKGLEHLARAGTLFRVTGAKWAHFRDPKAWKNFDMDQFVRYQEAFKKGQRFDLLNLEARLAYLENLGARFGGIHQQLQQMKGKKRRRFLRALKRLRAQRLHGPAAARSLLADLYLIKYTPSANLYFALRGQHAQRASKALQQIAERKLLEVGILKFFDGLGGPLPKGFVPQLTRAYQHLVDSRYFSPLKKLPLFPYLLPKPVEMKITREQALRIFLHGVESEEFLLAQHKEIIYLRYTVDFSHPVVFAAYYYFLWERTQKMLEKFGAQYKQKLFDWVRGHGQDTEQQVEAYANRTKEDMALELLEKTIANLEQDLKRAPTAEERQTLTVMAYERYGLTPP